MLIYLTNYITINEFNNRINTKVTRGIYKIKTVCRCLYYQNNVAPGQIVNIYVYHYLYNDKHIELGIDRAIIIFTLYITIKSTICYEGLFAITELNKIIKIADIINRTQYKIDITLNDHENNKVYPNEYDNIQITNNDNSNINIYSYYNDIDSLNLEN